MTLKKLLILLEPHFPHLKERENNVQTTQGFEGIQWR